MITHPALPGSNAGEHTCLSLYTLVAYDVECNATCSGACAAAFSSTYVLRCMHCFIAVNPIGCSCDCVQCSYDCVQCSCDCVQCSCNCVQCSCDCVQCGPTPQIAMRLQSTIGLRGEHSLIKKRITHSRKNMNSAALESKSVNPHLSLSPHTLVPRTYARTHAPAHLPPRTCPHIPSTTHLFPHTCSHSPAPAHPAPHTCHHSRLNRRNAVALAPSYKLTLIPSLPSDTSPPTVTAHFRAPTVTAHFRASTPTPTETAHFKAQTQPPQ